MGDDDARTFSTKERKVAAKKGQAQPGGSFPIKNQQDLKNAIQAYGRSKNKAATKRHIIKRARALGLTKLLPKGWGTDKAGASDMSHARVSAIVDAASLDVHGRTVCPAPGCDRAFLSVDQLEDHAEAVHTFGDVERLVSEAVREKFGRRGDYQANPPIPSIYCWVNDIATDWVVFTVEGGDTQIKETLYKAPYTVAEDGKVSIGTPVHVRRRTVYEVVGSEPETPEVIGK
jgi:hypothetical protein